MNNTNKLSNEINSFKQIWRGGFRTGYSPKRNQKGLEDYLLNGLSGKTCLEIGCGGGQWSKHIYNQNIFDKIYCIDVLSEEHNQFWNYVGEDKKDKIEYIQVDDFSLNNIPDNSIDYVFSYDVFCHISYSGQKEYISTLTKKCKTSCILNIMYADAEKYLNNEPENKWFVKGYLPNKAEGINSDEDLIKLALLDKDGEHITGRWYWVGIQNFNNLIKEYGFKILSEDLNIDKTNPITLFLK